MTIKRSGFIRLEHLVAIVIVAVALVLGLGSWTFLRNSGIARARPVVELSSPSRNLAKGYSRRMMELDISGLATLGPMLPKWKPEASLKEISDIWKGAGYRAIEKIGRQLESTALSDDQRIMQMLTKSALWNYEGEAEKSYQVLEELRSFVGHDEQLAKKMLATVIFHQGVSAMRQGENQNCIMCRGDSSCIIPISPTAIHSNPSGSRLAIKHFTEYLDQFPDDLEASWLLNVAHMTLGEYPDRVDSRFRLDLRQFFHSELDVGKFRDVAHLVGVNRFNQAGGAIMDDFDNDGLLDIVVGSLDCTQTMSYYRNSGDSRFEDRSNEAGVTDQLGGFVLYQADYDNDGWLDIVIPRGAWMPTPIRPTLLRNNRAGGFIDVTEEAGLLTPLNSNGAAWADYDNDGLIDLFIACEQQYNRLYRNIGNGKFQDVAAKAKVRGNPKLFAKGCAWIDYDNDDFPDLFVNNLGGDARLYHNNRNGSFTDVVLSMGIDGPGQGFSCWSWDYNNDGWLDIFATSYDRTLGDVVKGLLGQPHSRNSNRLYRNVGGKEFVNETAKAGLDMVFATMGSNYGDFDNDGFLDMYLGTGEPSIATLIPNRMFKNVAGEQFSEITASSGTGLLQKGHGVACGDWDRDGDVDIFAQTGGAVNGDKYHNVLFQNPGQGNHWLTVKLLGKKSNRAAIGARIKVVTTGEKPLTVHRHVSSGSSFGDNPLQQTIGLGKEARVALIEIHWPTSGTTQVFRDIPADQAIEVTEFAETIRPLDWKPLSQPQ
jgi:hypothetical protein